MSKTNSQHYDAVVIGAGMSGLAAAIRLSMYDRSVLLLERHNAPGGLNSFYRQGGHSFDVGLHALTNWVPQGTKRTPLGKIFRQLRIQRESFDLCEQTKSAVRFPSLTLEFSNDFELLRSEVAKHFPREIDNFNAFTRYVSEFQAVKLESYSSSARDEIGRHLKDPLLVEMLLCPLLYYGSARENDMDFEQFVVLFQSIFQEGFCRPYDGVRPIISTLLKRAKEVGVERKMGLGVKSLHSDGKRISHITLDNGEKITAEHVVSSMGSNETEFICSDSQLDPSVETNIGRLSFTESIAVLNQSPKDLGFDHTIVFFSQNDKLAYQRPGDLWDLQSGVICVPNNYDYGERELKDGILRVTVQANYHKWQQLSKEAYIRQKDIAYEQILKTACAVTPESSHPDLMGSITARDIFTPTTITHFTGHFSGAVYGAPVKNKDGSTRLENLYLCGTDQGFLGIIGSMLSGISIANYHVLQGS